MVFFTFEINFTMAHTKVGPLPYQVSSDKPPKNLSSEKHPSLVVQKVGAKDIRFIITWTQCYKAFSVHNLQILIISVCTWQAFPA
jgi:hypothetical protein